MKTILISLLLLATTTHAESTPYYGSGAPIFANLKVASITRNITTVNPQINSIIGGGIQFNEKKLNLTLIKKMRDCAPGMMCTQVMPTPISIKLDIVSIKNETCATVYTAVTPAHIKSLISEVVTVVDHTYSTCNFLIAPVNTVTYEVTGISSLTKQQETATAHFNVDGEFVRAQR